MPRRTLKVPRSCKQCDAAKARDSTGVPSAARSPGMGNQALQRLAGTSAAPSTTSSSVESFVGGLEGRGTPLSHAERRFMEPRFDADFGAVRVHADAAANRSAAELDAHAYTVGNHIVFGANAYDSNSMTGQKLLAHELTHVVQQRSDTLQPQLIQRADLSSPRLAGNTVFEDLRDNRDVIESGDTGPEVRRIQQLLIDLGFSLPVDGANGVFGTETENAVKEFQRTRTPPLTDDGRVGFRTIAAFDAAFPSFTMPANQTDPWSMPCVLGILCPWNRHLVETVLPTFTIVTFDSREFPTETWDGSSWVAGTFQSGGFTSRTGKRMGFLNTATCEEFASTVYHEGWHGQQPSSLTGVVDSERDAYINSEQWMISLGLPGQSFVDDVTGSTVDLRDSVGGETVVDEAAAEALVRQEYGGVSATPGERVLARVGATEVRVRRPDGTEYERPAAVGESVRGSVVMTNLATIDPANWVCP